MEHLYSVQSDLTVRYKINQSDVIIFVNEAWNRFALENDAPDVSADNVLNCSLWNFIKDKTTIQLYKEILRLVRQDNLVEFKLNCDAPGKNRVMKMTISAENDGVVQFQTLTVEGKERPAQKIIDKNALRTDGLIHMCSWCKSIFTGEEGWQELGKAISTLGLFDLDKLPHVTHGMCDSCYQTMTKKLTDMRNPKSGC